MWGGFVAVFALRGFPSVDWLSFCFGACLLMGSLFSFYRPKTGCIVVGVLVGGGTFFASDLLFVKWVVAPFVPVFYIYLGREIDRRKTQT